MRGLVVSAFSLALVVAIGLGIHFGMAALFPAKPYKHSGDDPACLFTKRDDCPRAGKDPLEILPVKDR